MRATRSGMLLLLAIALAGCAGGEARPPEPLEKREAAITGCLAKSVTTVATVVYDYDLAGRQTRDRDARLLYDPWNQLKEVQLITTTSPRYNDGRTVVAEKHTYGFDGIRTSSTTNPGAANAAVRVQITPDDLIHDNKREHYVRIGNRIVARLAMTASGTLALNDPPSARAGGNGRSAGVALSSSPASSPPPPWPVLGLAALVLGAAALLTWRRRRRWAPSVAGVVLLAASCQMFGEGVVGNSASLLLAEKVYYHRSLGAGPSLITRQDGTILEERRFEPFGVPIDAFRSGRTGTAAVDLVTDPQSIVGKQADATNGFTDHGARWLSPQSARWLTPDPAQRSPSARGFFRQFRDLNPYSYVSQNPIAYWDPDGQQTMPTYVYDRPDHPGETAAAVGKNGEEVLKIPGAMVELAECATVGCNKAWAPEPTTKTEPRRTLGQEVVAYGAFWGGGLIGRALGKIASFFGRSGGEAAAAAGARDLHAEAVAARDALAADLAKAKHPPATVVGAYSPASGEVTAAASRGGGLGCAEGVCSEALGRPSDIQFTPAVRPRTGATVDVCETCESTYGRDAFPDPATRFRSDDE